MKDGLAVDVMVGNAAFDEAYVVEAAPESVVREVFDARTCARLVALHPAEVVTKPGRLQLAKKGSIVGADRVDEAIDLAATVAARVEVAFEKLDGLEREGPLAAGYHSAAAGGERERAANEVAAARDVQARRARAPRAPALRARRGRRGFGSISDGLGVARADHFADDATRRPISLASNTAVQKERSRASPAGGFAPFSPGWWPCDGGASLEDMLQALAGAAVQP